MTSVRPTLCNTVNFKHKTFIFKDISKEFRRENYHQTRRLEGGTRKHTVD